jgi:uncharacterized membrane protein
MIPEPLHPAIVHFPIAFAALMPIAALIALLAIQRGASVGAAWLPVVALAGALAALSWLAVGTGEHDEEAVERVVSEAAIHEHEERAELFLALTVAGLLITALGLLDDRRGRVMRGLTVASTAIVLVAGYRVGHSGGELVYRSGAASAYIHNDSPVTAGERADDAEGVDGTPLPGPVTGEGMDHVHLRTMVGQASGA